MTQKEKLDSYIRTYQKGAFLIDAGFGKWTVAGNKHQYAAIARKAILLGMKVRFIDAEDCFQSMQVFY